MVMYAIMIYGNENHYGQKFNYLIKLEVLPFWGYFLSEQLMIRTNLLCSITSF